MYIVHIEKVNTIDKISKDLLKSPQCSYRMDITIFDIIRLKMKRKSYGVLTWETNGISYRAINARRYSRAKRLAYESSPIIDVCTILNMYA